jgi:CHASE1-domain containing sensor protein
MSPANVMPKSRHMRRVRFLAWGLFVMGVALSLAASLWQRRVNTRFRDERLSARAENAAELVVARLHTYEYGLRGARGLVIAAGANGLTREIFGDYMRSRDLKREFPGARAFGFVRRVPADDVASFIALARKHGQPDFAVRQLSEHPGERWLIQFIEPREENRQAVGLDIASESNRRRAAEVAMETGQATLTAPITLVQAQAAPQRAFLLLLPHYAPKLPLTTKAERKLALVGWTYTPLLIEEVLRGVDLGNGLDVRLSDVTESGAPLTFFATRKFAQGLAGLERVMNRELYGRRWRVEVRPQPRFLSELNQVDPLVVFGIGLLASALLTALFQLHSLAEKREHDAILQQAYFNELVEHSSDAVIRESPDGVVVGWNRGAEVIFGHSAEQALGRTPANT